MKKYFLPLLVLGLACGSFVSAQVADTTTTTSTTTTTVVIRPLTLNVPKEDLKSALNILDNGNFQISIKAGMVLNTEGDIITVSVFNQVFKANVNSARITNANWINLDKSMIRPGDMVNIFGILNSDFSVISVKTFRNISLRDNKLKVRDLPETTTITIASMEKVEQLQEFQNKVEEEKNRIIQEQNTGKDVEQKQVGIIQGLIKRLQDLIK